MRVERTVSHCVALPLLGNSLALESHAEGLRVVFPSLGLSAGTEFIEEVHLSVACGHIESVAGIPHDWSIEIVRMAAGEGQLHASAGHGASRLEALGRFNGGIRVVPQEAQCFDVSAKIKVSGEHHREIDLPRRRLKLLP